MRMLHAILIATTLPVFLMLLHCNVTFEIGMHVSR